MRAIDLTGNRYHFLVAIRRVCGSRWLFNCDCGVQKEIASAHVVAGRISSCGCFRSKSLRIKNTTHGLCSNPLFQVWKNMMYRCYDSTYEDYHRYGGRCIKVCDRWHSAVNFISDIESILGPRPDKQSLDRINNDGNYDPSNIRWATILIQNNNKRQTTVDLTEEQLCIIRLENINGTSQKELARKFGVSHGTIGNIVSYIERFKTK